MWFLFSFLSAFGQAAYYGISKQFGKTLSPYALAGGNFFAALPFLIGYIIIFGWPDIGSNFFLAASASALIGSCATIILYKALDYVDLAKAAPIIALTPVFSLLTAYIMIGERPNIWGVAGVIISIVGFIFVAYEHHEGKCTLKEKIKIQKQKKGVALLVFLAFLYSFWAVTDKITAIDSNIFFASFFVLSAVGIISILIGATKGDFAIIKTKENFFKSFLLGLFSIVTSIIWFAAISGGLVSYTLAIKRLSVIISFIFGYFLFKEKNFAKRRLLGAVVVLAGIFLILFFK